MENETKQTLGQLFKETRLSLELHVENISKETKISKSILINLENDDLEQLPKKIYVVGFVKTYARILNLDEDDCLQRLEELYSCQLLDEHDENSEDVILKQHKIQRNPIQNWMYIAPVIVIILAIIVFTNQKDNQPLPPPSTPAPTVTNQPPSELQVQEVKEEELTTTATSDSTTASIATNKKTDSNSEKIADKEKQESTVAKEPTEKNKEEKKKKEIRFSNFILPLYQIDENSEEQKLLPESIKNKYNANLQNLYLLASGGDSWLTYQRDQGDIVKYILKDGKDLFLQAQRIKIFIGNVNVVRLFLNNQLLKVSSRSGVKSLVFPQEDAKKLKIPLFIFQDDGTVISSEEFLKKQEQESSSSEEN